MKVALLYPNADCDWQQPLLPHHQQLRTDLELESIFDACMGDELFREVLVQQLLQQEACGVAVAEYRQHVMADVIENSEVVERIYTLSCEARAKKREQFFFPSTSHSASTLFAARRMLQVYLGFLRELVGVAQETKQQFLSAGWQQFWHTVEVTCSEDFFTKAFALLSECEFRNGALLSSSLGLFSEPRSYQIFPMAATPWKKLRRKFSSSASFSLHPRDEAGGKIFSEMKDLAVDELAHLLYQSAEHVDRFFSSLGRELAFYLAQLRLYQKVQAAGGEVTFPRFTQKGEDFEIANLYDLSLLLHGEGVVANSTPPHPGELLLITGANQGGKSTFLRSIGLAQLMARAGMFVPAAHASLAYCRAIFSHYRREEDRELKQGKFAEELQRMSDIVDQLSADSLLLCNESFAATNDREGSEIAKQIVSALLEKGVRVYFVTHLYDFPRAMAKKNPLYLAACREEDGGRSFRLQLRPPRESGEGLDLYHTLFS